MLIDRSHGSTVACGRIVPRNRQCKVLTAALPQPVMLSHIQRRGVRQWLAVVFVSYLHHLQA
jgi:hypothetical protein